MVAIKLSNKDPEFINTINNLAEKKDFILRIVNDNTKKDIVKNRTKFVLTGVSTLADAISSSDVDDEVKRIASAITKPGVTPRTVLNEMLSDYVGQLPLVQFERSEKLNWGDSYRWAEIRIIFSKIGIRSQTHSRGYSDG